MRFLYSVKPYLTTVSWRHNQIVNTWSKQKKKVNLCVISLVKTYRIMNSHCILITYYAEISYSWSEDLYACHNAFPPCNYVHPEDFDKSVPVLLINKIYSTYSKSKPKELVFEIVECFSIKIYWKNKLGHLTEKRRTYAR